MQISESKLRQIIIESIEQAGLDEQVVTQIEEVIGGLKALGRAGADIYKGGEYDSNKIRTLRKSLKALNKLKTNADKFEQNQDIKAAIDNAIKSLRSALPPEGGDDATSRRIQPGRDEPGGRTDRLARLRGTDAETEPESETPSAPTPVEPTEEPPPRIQMPPPPSQPATASDDKPKINVMRGRGGAQSQLQRAGVSGKDMGRILKGLKSDLTAAGFDTLEEVSEAKRKTIKLDKTLKAIERMQDPAQKEKAKKAIVNILRQNKLKVSDPRLRPSRPQRSATPRPSATPRSSTRQRRQRSPSRAGAGAPIPANRGRRLPENNENTSKDLISEQQIARFVEIAGIKKGE